MYMHMQLLTQANAVRTFIDEPCELALGEDSAHEVHARKGVDLYWPQLQLALQPVVLLISATSTNTPNNHHMIACSMVSQASVAYD